MIAPKGDAQAFEGYDNDRLPYVESQQRKEHIKKIETLSLESLVENERRIRNDRALVCTKTAIKIPIVAIGQYIPGLSRYVAMRSSNTEKTYHPDDSGEQRTASWIGFLDLIDGDVGVLLPNLGSRVNDPVKAIFKAAFSHNDSVSECARFTINLMDVRLVIASRKSKKPEGTGNINTAHEPSPAKINSTLVAK